jgi:vancomycin resistance protein YoaR
VDDLEPIPGFELERSVLGPRDHSLVALDSDRSIDLEGPQQFGNGTTRFEDKRLAIHRELHGPGVARVGSRVEQKFAGARASGLTKGAMVPRHIPEPRRLRTGLWLSLMLLSLGGAALGLAVLVERSLVYATIRGDVYALSPDGHDADELVELVSQKFARQEVVLLAGDALYEGTRAELGFSVNPVELEQALREGLERQKQQPRSLSARVAEKITRLRPDPGGYSELAVELPLRFEGERARRVISAIAARVQRFPMDAELLIEEHRIQKSAPGRELSIEASLERIERQGSSEDVIELQVDEIEPDVTEEELLPVDITRVLSTFETSFRGKAGPRAVNIRNAARFLNGAVLLPGEALSFNSRVGRRVHGRGFVDAPVIVNDEMDEDVGGGVCQVATTLHAAAVFANLDVLERRSHSRPSGYAPIGLDATVIDGKVDLRLRNPYDEPLLVHAYLPEPYLVRVELLGRLPDVKVEHAALVKSQEPFARRVWHKPEAGPGAFVQKQKGSPGLEVVSVLVVRQNGRETSRRSYFSKYYPVPEVFYVGEGFFTAQLPPMPEGATGIVIDGEEISETASLSGATERDMTRTPTIDESNGITRDSTARPD